MGGKWEDCEGAKKEMEGGMKEGSAAVTTRVFIV